MISGLTAPRHCMEFCVLKNQLSIKWNFEVSKTTWML